MSEWIIIGRMLATGVAAPQLKKFLSDLQGIAATDEYVNAIAQAPFRSGLTHLSDALKRKKVTDQLKEIEQAKNAFVQAQSIEIGLGAKADPHRLTRIYYYTAICWHLLGEQSLFQESAEKAFLSANQAWLEINSDLSDTEKAIQLAAVGGGSVALIGGFLVGTAILANLFVIALPIAGVAMLGNEVVNFFKSPEQKQKEKAEAERKAKEEELKAALEKEKQEREAELAKLEKSAREKMSEEMSAILASLREVLVTFESRYLDEQLVKERMSPVKNIRWGKIFG
jgi:hypothetical protein